MCTPVYSNAPDVPLRLQKKFCFFKTIFYAVNFFHAAYSVLT
uniref:Uncharacterized protein n=1 Tax=Anguilla anguilla TaxID=7936 RepID=A0A0E9RJV3_ANGAN